MVSTADMGPFMGNDMGHGIFIQVHRQVDFGMYQPQDKRKTGPFTAIKVALYPDCRTHALSQTDITANRIEQENPDAHRPNDRRNGNPNLERIGAVFRRRCRALFQNGIHRGIEHRKAAVDGRDRGQQRFRRDGLCAGNQAPNAFQGEWAHQTHSHQAPQQETGPLGRFFQKQPQHQNRQHQPSGGNSTIEQA